MPIYEFECSACEAVFERLQKLSDPDPVECPECGRPKVKRRLTAPAFRLAGSGWYETDFKKDGDRKRNLANKDEAARPVADATKSDTSAQPGAGAKADAAPVKPAANTAATSTSAPGTGKSSA